MSQQKRIGVLTPSSNTALEPLTSAMVAGVPGVTAHFSRFRVTEISMGDKSPKAKDKAKKLLRRNACAYKGPCQGVSGCVAGGPGGGTCVPIQSPCPAGCTAGRACAGCCPTNPRELGFCFDSINGGCPTNAPCC